MAAVHEPTARGRAALLSLELPPEAEELLLLLELELELEEFDALEGLAVRWPLTSVGDRISTVV